MEQDFGSIGLEHCWISPNRCHEYIGSQPHWSTMFLPVGEVLLCGQLTYLDLMQVHTEPRPTGAMRPDEPRSFRQPGRPCLCLQEAFHVQCAQDSRCRCLAHASHLSQAARFRLSGLTLSGVTPTKPTRRRLYAPKQRNQLLFVLLASAHVGPFARTLSEVRRDRQREAEDSSDRLQETIPSLEVRDLAIVEQARPLVRSKRARTAAKRQRKRKSRI